MYDNHISLEQSQKAKVSDKVRVNEDNSFNSITIDLQKVLHLPTSNVSLLYYLRKLNVYNATIYGARSPNDGICYLWSEVDGKKGSDEVGTALYLWIQRLPPTVTEISISSYPPYDQLILKDKLQWLKVKCFRFEKERPNIVQYKYDYISDYKELDVSKKETAIVTNTKNLRKRKNNESVWMSLTP
ncbi:hypothetical protein ACJJTC_002344 [Scirpophaga incertulas]